MDRKLPLEFAEKLVELVAADRAGRGVSRLSKPEDWQRAADALCALKSVAVVSGFYIPCAKAPETDGPGGAVILARAFMRMGRASVLWTDELCLGAMKECARAASFPEEQVLVYHEGLPLPEGIIFTERLGRAADGAYYNFKKVNISEWTPPLDELAFEAVRKGIVTAGIGDGGNEVGMGNFYDELSALIPQYKECLCTVRTDYALAADVSNWGAYALAAALSQLFGKWCGAEAHEEKAMLEALKAAGAVDGISRKPQLTVDGFDLSVQSVIISSLKDLWLRCN